MSVFPVESEITALLGVSTTGVVAIGSAFGVVSGAGVGEIAAGVSLNSGTTDFFSFSFSLTVFFPLFLSKAPKSIFPITFI